MEGLGIYFFLRNLLRSSVKTFIFVLINYLFWKKLGLK